MQQIAHQPHHGNNIERLDEQLRLFAEAYPGSYGLLRHSPNVFDACTVPVWHARGWRHVEQAEIGPLLDGNNVERLAALLKLVHAHGVRRVEFAAGADLLEVVPLVPRAAA
ncbi:MAG TPA: hypothetical protein VHX65_10995 [Pirellulales bacterium]|jgi:hypothetical protein|nr:hypothetical protein [Pirellulales bacterium]